MVKCKLCNRKSKKLLNDKKRFLTLSVSFFLEMLCIHILHKNSKHFILKQQSFNIFDQNY